MYVFVWICVCLWGYVYIHECVNEYICMNACTHIWVYMWMYVCKCKSMNTYVYMWKHAWAHFYVHEWICIYACMHGCAYVYEFTYVCGIVCVYMEEELSYCILGEKNLEKWSEGWCWYSAKGWDSGVLRTESLFLFPFVLRRKMGRVQACLGLLCCLSIWCSRFCRDNILELAVSRGPLNRSMGGCRLRLGLPQCLLSLKKWRPEARQQLSAAGMGHTGCRHLWPYDLKCRIFWFCPFVLSKLQT